jgi:two-component system, OmpR family, sensor kinase
VNRLWVRLSLVSAALVALSAAVVLGAGLLVGQDARRSPLTAQFGGPDGLAVAAAAAYQAGGWDGVAAALAAARSGAPPGVRERVGYAILDPAGALVRTVPPGLALPAGGLGRSPSPVPIIVAGRVVGAVRLTDDQAGAADVRGFLADTLVRLAVLGALIGLGVSIAASRWLTAPLERLAAAARRIGGGDLAVRVPATGSAEMVALATAFNGMAASLERSEAARRRLVADVAHELRTPLAVLKANLTAMLDGVLPTEPAELERLLAQADVLTRLVADLTDLTQAEAGQLGLRREPLDVVALARQIVAAHAPTAEAAGVTLGVDALEPVPPVLADGERLAQVLHNLLANAVRHTPAGGHVSVTIRPAGPGVALAVVDDGEGIPAEALGQVFERFYRADPSRRRDTGGAGLGLPIARAIVDAHGGRIEVASAGASQGTTVTVTLDGAPT